MKKKYNTFGFELTDLKETKTILAIYKPNNCEILPRNPKLRGFLVHLNLVSSF